MIEHAHPRMLADARPQQPADLAAGGITRVQHAAHAMRALASERGLAGAIAIERGAPVQQLLDVDNAVLDHDPHRVFVAEAIAGRHRVGEMFFGRIFGADGGGDAALRVAGVAFGWIGLGEDGDAAVLGEIDGGAQTRRCRCR